MVDLRPFRGLRYNESKVESLEAVLAPPFDVIPETLREKLLRRSPHNVVHVTLAGEVGGDWHDEAAARFRAWKREGVLRQDREPSFYSYEHWFEWKGVPTHRLGLVGIVRLEEDREREIYPHEHTFPAARRDRLKLLSACRANLEPIFLLFPDPERKVAEVIGQAERVDRVEARSDDQTRQVFWRISDPEAIRTIRKLMAGKNLLVADGHHRFATAKDYRDAQWAESDERDREAPYNFQVVHLAAMEDPALRILPTHRTVQGISPEAIASLPDGLSRLYEIHPEKREVGDLAAGLVDVEGEGPEIIAYMGGRSLSLVPRNDGAMQAAMGGDHSALWSSLPASRLHRLILEGMLGIRRDRLAECVRFHRSPVEAAELVDRGEAQAAFFLRSVKPRVVWDLAREGEMMPQKSTDFFPKFPSGFIFYSFE